MAPSVPKQQLLDVLSDFAVPDDLADNPAVFPIGAQGKISTSFRRGCFNAHPDHPVSLALRAYEDGNADAIKVLDQLRSELGISIDLITCPSEIPGNGPLITHIVINRTIQDLLTL